MNKGLVIKNTGSWYLVETEDAKQVECKIKGTFRLKGIRTTNPLAVGDRVVFDIGPQGYGLISEIVDRKNYIIRRSSNLSKQSQIIGANLDQLFLIVTVNYPETSTIFIDRFLASAEAYNIPSKLIFNKVDLYSEAELEYMEALINLYDSLGYPCFKVSSTTGEGVDNLREELKEKITLFSGHSGVGKSTMINAIEPSIEAKTSDISSYHNKGMHTTTFSEMFILNKETYLIDTPGIKGFGTFDFKTEEVSHYFREIFAVSSRCKYNNCTHVHEPNCAVVKAVDNKEISKSRYNSYINLLGDDADEKYR